MSDSKWYFTNEQISNSPSRRDGIDTEREAYCRQCAAKLIQEVGQRLQLNQLAINTAVVYVHRFYMFHSFSRFQRHLIAPAALFLAAKVEEQPRKLEFVIRMANFTQERVNIEPKSQAYVEKVQQMIFHENVILQTLGFELAIEHPHTYVVNFFQSMRTKSLHSSEYDSQASESDLAKKAYYVATNSLHLTTLCLQFRPPLVACVCIFLVCKWNNYEQINFSDYQVIDPGCTMKMVENVASIVEKHQQFMKKLGPTVGIGANTSNLEDESLSKASKPPIDTTTNHNNNVDKKSVAKEISPALLSSSAKTVLTPKEYLDKKIKERINHRHQEAKHTIPSASDKHNLKNNGGHTSEHHDVCKAQMLNETLTKNSNSSQNASKNYSEVPHKFENSESINKPHKIHSESRHKAHKVNYSANNKTSKVHSDSLHKSSKDHTDSVNINSAHKISKSQFNSNIKSSGLIEVGHREFKAPPDYKIPKSTTEPAHKISKSHSEPDSLAYKLSSLSSEPAYKVNKVQSKESPQKIRSVVPDVASFKSNGEHQKIAKVHSNYDYELSRVTESVGKVADNRMLRFSSEDSYKTTNAQLEFKIKTSDINLAPMQVAYQVPPESIRETSKLRASSIDSSSSGIKMQIVNAASDQVTLKIPPELSYKIPKIKVDSSYKEYKSSSNFTSALTGRVSLESGYKNSPDFTNSTSGKMSLESNSKHFSDSTNNISGRMNSESVYKNSAAYISTSSCRMNLESDHKKISDSVYRKFKSSLEHESKMERSNFSTNVIHTANYESVHKEWSETNKKLEISKIDSTNVAQSASIDKTESDHRTHKFSSNSYKVHYDHKINVKTEADSAVLIGNNFNTVENANEFKLIDKTTVPSHADIKGNSEPVDQMSMGSSYLKPPMIHSDPRLSKVDQNAAIKGLLTKIHSENSHKSHKSHSRSSHKSHKKYAEKEHKRDLSEVSLDASLQPRPSKSHSKCGSQSLKSHHSNIKQEASAECSRSKIDDSSDSTKDVHSIVLGSKIISSEYHAESKNICKKYSHRVNDQLYKKLPMGIENRTPTDSEITKTNMLCNLNPVQTTQNVTLKTRLGLNDNLSQVCEQKEMENKATRNTLSVVRMEGENVMNSTIKSMNEKAEVKREVLPLKVENKELDLFNAFNFNSNFSLHDVLKPSEKPPEDIFDTETDFKMAPCISNIDTASSKSVNPVPEFLKPELPPRIIESQPLKAANNVTCRSTTICSLLPMVQQSLHSHKSSGNDTSIVPKNSSAFAVSPDKDPPITTEQVHAFYKELEARKRAESRLEGVSDIRAAVQTFQAETSGTSKKREHKHKKYKKDRHGDKEHKKNKKSKKNKKDKHRDRSKGEEPLPSIKISVFNNYRVSNPESLPSPSDNKPNNANVSTENSRIKLTIPFSRIHSNINTTSLEIESPKIKLKLPKESKKKSSKRSRGNSPESESRSSKRTRRSSSLTSVHNADYSRMSDSQQTPAPYGSADSQDQNKIQIRNFSHIS